MNKIPAGFLLPSAPLTIAKERICHYRESAKKPEAGDLIYGEILSLGHHSEIENRDGRVQPINDGDRGIFVFGNRYAPDQFEAFVPDAPVAEVDLVSHAGIVGVVRSKHSAAKDPSRVGVLGYVCTEAKETINMRQTPLMGGDLNGCRESEKGKLILVVGTSMNSGKSTAAAACCWALSSMGSDVRGSKITGSASLKEILILRDAGALNCNDFTHFGHSSTYMLEKEELLRIFLGSASANNSNAGSYWVVEFADGILQREVQLLLDSPEVRSRIHRLIFCAGEAIGCIGGLKVLKERYGLSAHALSGKFSSSPLARRELAEQLQVPIFDSMERDAVMIQGLLG